MGLSAGCCTHAFAVLNKRSLVAKVEIPPEMAKKTRAILKLSGDKQEKKPSKRPCFYCFILCQRHLACRIMAPKSIGF